jgi:hypothetical protein
LGAWHSAIQRVLVILGRFFEERCVTTGNSYLSKGRIRDRGFAFQKTTAGCEFSITRHLNAWNAPEKMKLLVEVWRVNIKERHFERVGERDWCSGDPT